MIFTAENILLVGSILLFVSIVVGKTGYRFGVPALLLFLVVGMLFGSDGLGLQFHNAKEAQFIGMVALSILWRYGYEIQRNQAYTSSRYCSFHSRSSAHSSIYRTIYMVAFRYELDKHLPAYHYFLAISFHHVINRFRISIRYTTLTEDELET